MSLLTCFRLSRALRKHLATTGPSALPLKLCLDLRARAPDQSKGEGAGSSRADTSDQSEGEGIVSSCASTSDESESEPENAWNSRGSILDESEEEDTCSTLDESEGEGTPDNAGSPAASTKRGGFDWDREKGGFNLEWANLAEFEMWHQVEECASSIELIASSTWTGVNYSRSQRFVCRRQYSGGRRKYQKKYPSRKCKIRNRKSGCRCHVLIKFYPHTPTILGHYIAEHNHKIGKANIAFTCLSGTTQERIKTMLTQKIDWDQIVSLLNQNSLAADLIHLKVRVIHNSAPDGSRDQLIALKEVNQIAQVLENDETRLHPSDAVSTRLVMENLAENRALTFYKDNQDCTLIGSGLPEDAFVLCIQTSFQLDAFQRLGNGFIGIDATHNITQYYNLLLFTIITRDRWGRGK